MITSKSVTTIGLVSVLIMAVAFSLVLFTLVPEEFTIPLFIMATLSFAVRITARIMFKRQQERFQAEDFTAPPGRDE